MASCSPSSKAPIPVHTWLPDAAENLTPGTALLVGVLDKIGTFE